MFITNTDAIHPGMLLLAPHIDGERLYFGRAGGRRWLERGGVRFKDGHFSRRAFCLVLVPQFVPVLYALPTPQAERQFLHRVHVAARMVNKVTR